MVDKETFDKLKEIWTPQLRTKGQSIILSFCAFVFVLAMQVPVQASSVLQTIERPGSHVYRILAGTASGEYWVADLGNGLRLLTEDSQGIWTCSQPFGDPLYDFTGPDINGYFYCSDYSLETGSCVRVFDCDMKTILQTIALGTDYPVTGLSLSSDMTNLFVLGQDWPRLGESYSFIDSGGHRDSGIVWKIDTTSLTVVG